MLVLSILHSPILFINTLGTNSKIGLSVSAAATTFGNLGSATDVGSVDIPGCDETEFQFSHCNIGQYCKACEWIMFVDTYASFKHFLTPMFLVH